MGVQKGQFRGIPKHELRARLAVKLAKGKPRSGAKLGDGKKINEAVDSMVQRLRLIQLRS